MSALIKRYRYAGRRRGRLQHMPAADPWAAHPLFGALYSPTVALPIYVRN